MMRTLVALALVIPALSGCQAKSAEPPRAATVLFEDRAQSSAIDFAHRSGRTQSLNLFQTSGGGCAVLDFDGDGLQDLFLMQGEHRPGATMGNRLFRNLGEWRFEDVTARAGVRGHGYGLGCTVGDFDGDGHEDLYVCNNGQNELFRNRGDGTFEEVAGKLGAKVSGCSVGAVFADLDHDGWPDLYVVRYVAFPSSGSPLCVQNGVPASCGPLHYEAQPGVFLHNQQGQGFVEKTIPAGLINAGRGMAALVCNWGDTRRPDLFVTNDSTANALFTPGKRGRYVDSALEAGVAYGTMGSAEGNMGCDAGDVDGDGRLDLVVGVMQDRPTLLFRNAGQGMFTLDTSQQELAAASTSVTTFAAALVDVDNDGALDLLHANGHVQDRAAEIDPRLAYRQPPQLFLNDGAGHFTAAGPRGGPVFARPIAGRGAAIGDLDNDGDLDILLNNLDGPPVLLCNRAEGLGRHWLRVRLRATAPDHSPEGLIARLQVGDHTLTRHLHRAVGYASASEPLLHFGLGSSTSVGALTIVWPDGSEQKESIIGVDREITVRQR